MLNEINTSHPDIVIWENKTLDVLLSLGVKKTKAIKKINLYYHEVLNLLQHQVKFSTFDVDNANIPLSVLRERVGRIKTNDGLRWVANLIQEHSPLFLIKQRGNQITKRMSKIDASRIFEVKILLDKTSEEVWDTFKEDWIDQPIHEIPVNIKSLKNFIDYTYQKYQTDSSTKRRDDLLSAIPILKIAEHTGGILPHAYTVANSGRIYYTGINLLTAPRTVRHAALAPCYEIDIENCAWQWKAHIGKELKCNTLFLDLYCNNKKAVRDGLVEEVFAYSTTMHEDTKLKLIKTALSAMGFGAQTPNGHISSGLAVKEAFSYRDSNNEKVYLTQARNNFVQHELIQGLQAESKAIDQQLTKLHRKDYEQCDFLKTEQGRWSTSRFVAYLYQSYETQLINSIQAESYLRDKTVIRIHDAIYGHYTKDDICSISYIIEQQGFKISVEKHDKWSKSLQGKEKLEYEQFIVEHKQRIQWEEQQAKGHYQQPIKTTLDYKSTGDQLIEHLQRTDPNSELLQDLRKQKTDSVYNQILTQRN